MLRRPLAPELAGWVICAYVCVPLMAGAAVLGQVRGQDGLTVAAVVTLMGSQLLGWSFKRDLRRGRVSSAA